MDIVVTIGLKEITGVTIRKSDDLDNAYIYTIETTDGTFQFRLWDSIVLRVLNENEEYVYTDSSIKEDDVDWQGLKNYTIDTIKSLLKAPSTAKFPGSWLDPFYGWDLGRSGNIVELSSYVDSQNSFGAMIRAYFTVQYKVDGSKYTPVFIYFDGNVILNSR